MWSESMGIRTNNLERRIGELENTVIQMRKEIDELRAAATMRVGEFNYLRDSYCDHRKIITAMDVVRWWMEKEGVEAKVIKASPEKVEFVKKE